MSRSDADSGDDEPDETHGHDDGGDETDGIYDSSFSDDSENTDIIYYHIECYNYGNTIYYNVLHSG